MNEKLKPCPYCGSDDVHLEEMGYPHHVYCSNCSARITGQGYEEEGEADAIRRWNRRASGWIHIKTRPLTEEEKEERPDLSYIFDCELPDDGQRILIHCVHNKHESVQLDEYYDDCGMGYLDSGYEIGEEVDAWMPLPEPPEVEE